MAENKNLTAENAERAESCKRKKEEGMKGLKTAEARQGKKGARDWQGRVQALKCRNIFPIFSPFVFP